MRKNEIIRKINEMYTSKDDILFLTDYVNENITKLNNYKSLYPIIGASGKIYLKYIPTNEEYIEFEKQNRQYMNTEAIKHNRRKYDIV